jgi:5-formyltetrahydrofolate cyclo-ligase
MDLAYVKQAQEIKPGAFNIPEPDRNVCQMLETFSPDIILLPGVGFDRQGFRLGYGGGYYDRFLTHPQLSQTLFLGIAFDFQLTDELPVEAWDKPVHGIITDREILWTN